MRNINQEVTNACVQSDTSTYFKVKTMTCFLIKCTSVTLNNPRTVDSRLWRSDWDEVRGHHTSLVEQPSAPTGPVTDVSGDVPGH